MGTSVKVRSFLAATFRSRALIDSAIALATLAVSLAVMSHGGVGPARPGWREIDFVGIAITACSTVPLIVWRRYPLGVFVLTASAGALVACLGYRIDLLLGPAAALFLVAASREPQDPLDLARHGHHGGNARRLLGASAAAQVAFPGGELLPSPRRGHSDGLAGRPIGVRTEFSRRR